MGAARNEVSRIREAGDHPPGRAVPPGRRVHFGQAGHSEDHLLSLLRSLSLHARCVNEDTGLIHHSDRGTQYVSIRYADRLNEAGIEPSVGSVGDAYDNALAETINGLYKTELIRQQGPWRNIEAVEFATLTGVDWFNNRRLLEPIGSIPPAELEMAYYQQLQELARAA